MSEIAIRAKGLNQLYRIAQRGQYGLLRARRSQIRPARSYGEAALRKIGKALQNLGTKLLEKQGWKGTWIDVGAHLGELTYAAARNNPRLTVFAFEPNWELARTTMGKLANFIVLPMAVAQEDGVAEFFVNDADFTSSLLPFSDSGLEAWKDFEGLKLKSKMTVPTIRLDTFMSYMKIDSVDFLKVDAQGADFDVIRSAGTDLERIEEVTLEVDIGVSKLY